MTRSRLVAGLALAATTLAACGINDGGSGDAPEGGAAGGHLIYAEQFPPAAAWALEANDAHALTRAGCLETLLKNGYDGELEPMLATKWEQVEPETWEFTLRDDVTFQDGTPMDAEAVAGALTHLLEVETPARAFNSTVISTVEATEEGTVQITTPARARLAPLGHRRGHGRDTLGGVAGAAREGGGLDQAAYAVDVPDVLDVRRRDDDAPVGLAHQDPLGDQLAQGLAQGVAGDAQGAGEALLG
jgi:hypothetical protein